MLLIRKNVTVFATLLCSFLIFSIPLCAAQNGDAADMDLLGSKNPVEKLPLGWKVLYDEDFEEDKPQGWELQSDDKVKVAVSWGKLKIANKQKEEKLFLFRELEINPLGDYRIEIKLNYDGSSDKKNFGLLWGTRRNNFYNQLGLTPKREAKLQVVWLDDHIAQEGEFAALRNLKKYEPLKSGSSSNILAIQRTGDRLAFFANGERLFATSDVLLLGNKFGFYLDPQTEIAVDRIVVAQDTSVLHAAEVLPYSDFAKKYRVEGAQFSPDGRRLMTNSNLQNKGSCFVCPSPDFLMFWDASMDDPTPLGSHLYWGEAVAFGHVFSFVRDGSLFAMIDPQSHPVVASLVDGKVSPAKVYNQFEALGLAVSPDGALLAVAERHKLHLVDIASQKVIATAEGPQKDDEFREVRFSPDGRFMGAIGLEKGGSFDYIAWLFQVQGLKHLASVPDVTYLNFNPQSSRVLAAIVTKKMKELAVIDLTGKILGTTSEPAVGEYLSQLAADETGDLLLHINGSALDFCALDDETITLIEEKKREEVHHYAAAYDASRNLWAAVLSDKLVRYGGPADKKIQARTLYAKAMELLANNFQRPAQVTLLEAFEKDPLVQSPDRLKNDLLAEKRLFLTLAGQAFLQQYHAELRGASDGADGTWALFYYGVAAARAGQTDSAGWAAAQIASSQEKGQKDLRQDMVNSLTGLTIAAQGRASEGYDEIILNGGISPAGAVKKFIMNYPEMWKPLYSDKKKLAYILDVKETELPAPSGQWPMPVSFPDKDGTMVEVVGGAAASTLPSASKGKKSSGVILLE